MKIGINGRFLTKPFTGIGQYTRYLFSAFAKQNPEYKILIVVPGGVNESVKNDFPKNVEFKIIPEKLFGISGFGTAGMKKTYWEQVQLPKYFLNQNVDLVHFPYPSNPWMGFKKPVIVTVHDTIPWELPEYRKNFLTRIYQDRCKKALVKADRVLTVSNSSKKSILDLQIVPESKITVIYNSVAEIFNKKISMAESHKVLNKYGIPSKTPYLFYIGGFDERKNVEQMVNAVNSVINGGADINLVLAGGKALNSNLYASFEKLTCAANGGNFKPDRGKIITTGFVDEADLPALYQSSFAFINVSKNEGFNLPLLEAAVSGVPVVTSDLAVHHEVLGQNAIYWDTENKEDLAKIIAKLVTDQDFYQKQKQKIEKFVNPFSWVESAKMLKDLY